MGNWFSMQRSELASPPESPGTSSEPTTTESTQESKESKPDLLTEKLKEIESIVQKFEKLLAEQERATPPKVTMVKEYLEETEQSPKSIQEVWAVKNFVAQEEPWLTVYQGEIVELIFSGQDRWCVKKNGVVGFVPGCCLRIFNRPEFDNQRAEEKFDINPNKPKDSLCKEFKSVGVNCDPSTKPKTIAFVQPREQTPSVQSDLLNLEQQSTSSGTTARFRNAFGLNDSGAATYEWVLQHGGISSNSSQSGRSVDCNQCGSCDRCTRQSITLNQPGTSSQCDNEVRNEVTCSQVAAGSGQEAEVASESLIRSLGKKCPGCQTDIEKSDGCNHMQCGACFVHFCWLCLSILDPGSLDVHFGKKCALIEVPPEDI